MTDTATGYDSLWPRIARLTVMFGFGFRCGGSMKDRLRLVYFAALKPTLASRGWTRYSPGRVIAFSMCVGRARKFKVHVRDNSPDDLGTVAEYFSSRHQILPPELPPFEPAVVYDIGGHIGSASLYFAAHYPNARFYGFEPLPSNHAICVLNYRNLPGSQVFPWAVGQQDETSVFTFSERDLRGGRLRTGVSADPASPTKQVEVNVVSIGSLIDQKRLPLPDFMKIDAEGAEADILKGMGEHYRGVRRILIETHGEHLQVACLKWLVDHGFLVRHVHEAMPGFASIWADRL